MELQLLLFKASEVLYYFAKLRMERNYQEDQDVSEIMSIL
jgi:hypothetical protein